MKEEVGGEGGEKGGAEGRGRARDSMQHGKGGIEGGLWHRTRA
jgi:hypothetical protein